MAFITHPPLGSTKVFPPFDQDRVLAVEEEFLRNHYTTQGKVLYALCKLTDDWNRNMFEDYWIKFLIPKCCGDKMQMNFTEEDWQRLLEEVVGKKEEVKSKK